MKLKLIIPLLCRFIIFTVTAQNPVSPPGVYLADPTARVMLDGKLYLYGSNDESPDYYCSDIYHLLSTFDMINWTVTKDIFSLNSHNKGGRKTFLYAPDCLERDGKYYMYYCLSEGPEDEWVAVSDSPEGPFGNETAISGISGIDPAVFRDDDGQTYYFWGQFNAKGAKLNKDGRSIDQSSVCNDLVTEKEHRFHEGGWMFKRNGIYYFVYTSLSERGEATTIGYSTSDHPLGPFTYGGTIIDNFGCDPKTWNNHGSVVAYKDEWYIFYHRSTHASNSMRKACVEKIHFDEDGSIPQVEMTSQGAGQSLNAFSVIGAERACFLTGKVCITLASANNEELSDIEHYNTATFKYLDFPRSPRKLVVRASSISGGKICLYTNDMFRAHAVLNIPPGDGKTYTDYSVDVENIKPGIYPVRFRFIGEEEKKLMRMNSFRFE
ncbi:MAG: family 43 glycosylhydrolase [Tannerella sp.]|jgi:hypothetical protein|nr:family 43 glycosylhydrolase [Tannerella sp.]